MAEVHSEIKATVRACYELAFASRRITSLWLSRGPRSARRRQTTAAFALSVSRLRLRWAAALVPASPSIEAAAADQKHDDDDNEKSCHIHEGVSYSDVRLPPTISLWPRGLRP
jgi:hypothetical protein